MQASQEHLRKRLRQQAGQTGEIYRDGVRIHADVVFVPTSYNAVVKTMEDTGTAAKLKVWIVGVDQVPLEPDEGDEYRVAGDVFRVVRDQFTDRRWQWHSASEKARAVFTVLWEDN